jgi:hypothetical protein
MTSGSGVLEHEKPFYFFIFFGHIEQKGGEEKKKKARIVTKAAADAEADPTLDHGAHRFAGLAHDDHNGGGRKTRTRKGKRAVGLRAIG